MASRPPNHVRMGVSNLHT